jgi:hypothetical protein
MKKWLCKKLSSCCGLRGWLFRILGCAEFEKQPFTTIEWCVKSDKAALSWCVDTYPRTLLDREFGYIKLCDKCLP